LVSGSVARIGLAGGTLTVAVANAQPETRPLDAPDHERALEAVLTDLDGRVGISHLAAVGHRIVHGGPRFERATSITGEVLSELRRLAPLDVEHLPAEISI